MPDNVILPWLLSTKRTTPPYARPHAAYLGGEFDPLWGEFHGTRDAQHHAARHGATAEDFRDPHLGITPESRFEIRRRNRRSTDDMTLDRLNTRRSLLEQFDAARRELGPARAPAAGSTRTARARSR